MHNQPWLCACVTAMYDIIINMKKLNTSSFFIYLLDPTSDMQCLTFNEKDQALNFVKKKSMRNLLFKHTTKIHCACALSPI